MILVLSFLCLICFYPTSFHPLPFDVLRDPRDSLDADAVESAFDQFRNAKLEVIKEPVCARVPHRPDPKRNGQPVIVSRIGSLGLTATTTIVQRPSGRDARAKNFSARWSGGSR